MRDVLITNAAIIDGTGADAYTGSVGIRGGRLTFRPLESPVVLDASGLTLCPGFIDAHSHGDLLQNEFGALTKLSQGITTQVVGQCGVSMYPAHPDMETHRKFVSGICARPVLPGPEALQSYAAYTSYLNRGMYLNAACFIGLGSLRMAVMGQGDRGPSRGEMEQMKALLREAMRAGALGLSTGLVYAPCCYADEAEITELLKVAAEFGGTYATHIRDESDGAPEALGEAVRCAKSAGVHLNVSHFKASGRRNWGTAAAMLAQLDEAAAEGLQLTVDQYPYTAGMTALNVSVPPEYRVDMDTLNRALNDPAARRDMRARMSTPQGYENYILNSGGFSGVYVSSCPEFHGAEGMRVSEYASLAGQDEFDAYFDILAKNHGLGLAVYFHMSERDVRDIAAYRHTVVGTDGLPASMEENGHPRAFGSFPRAICAYVKEQKLFALEQMIHRMTGMTAARLGLPGKGRIAEGCDADLVLLDYDRLRDKATYANSNQVAEGIARVLVGGQTVYENGRMTGAKAGRVTPMGQRSCL